MHDDGALITAEEAMCRIGEAAGIIKDYVDSKIAAIEPAGGGLRSVVDRDSSMVVAVTSKPADGSAYVAGETIEYEADFTNDSIVLLKDMTAETTLGNIDPAAGANIDPESSRKFDGSYTVTDDDYGKTPAVTVTVGNDIVTKTATSSPVSIAQPTRKVASSIEVTSKGSAIGGFYTTNDELTYLVTVTNTGNVTLHDVDVSVSLGTLEEA